MNNFTLQWIIKLFMMVKFKGVSCYYTLLEFISSN